MRPTVSLHSGRVELLAGDAVVAERELRRGYEHLSQIGERYLRSSVAGLLAEAVAAQGRIDDAEALASEAEELSADDDVDAQTLWRLAKAYVLAQRGELSEAEARAREAVALLAPTDYVLNQVSALACLASILLLAGAESEAAELLDRASALSRSKGSGIMLERVAEVNAPRASTSAQPLSDSVI